MKKKIIIVVGTRSEIIKFSSLIRELKKDGFFEIKILDSGQTYTGSFMRELKLPEPDIRLGKSLRERWSKSRKLASSFYAVVWLCKIFFGMRKAFVDEEPDAIFYQGNCMSVPVAVFASKTVLKKTALIHRESGIRTHNIFEPFLGELSEKVGDYFGDILFAPSKSAENNLKNENIRGKIFLVGDPQVEIVDYVLKNIKPQRERITGEYVVVNVLHFENVADKNKMQNLIEILQKSPLKVVFPMSKSVKGRLELFGLLNMLKKSENILLSEPYNYADFLNLVKNASAVLTDSGGVQQESLILKVPCIFLGKENVWEEFESRGIIKSTHFDVGKTLGLLAEIKNHGDFYKKVKSTRYPIGDGRATQRMVAVLKGELGA